VLVLLMGVIYEVSLEIVSGSMICIPSFMMITSGIQVMRLLLQHSDRLQSFTKTGTGAKANCKFCLSYLGDRNDNIRITDGRDL
jgi:hypothetical protein